ncbi:MAG: ATP-binding protein [Lachnospiraceae bacterium]|jgi:predicted AAA+ superfamily ATPase|nr:ATP-binding protein [Lachnospiraceae bacterium]
MYIKRHIESAIIERSREKGAIIVTGARQTGKTTLIEHLKPEINRITFDDLAIRDSATSEPAAFLQLYQPPLFIDEVQYVPDIFNYIKIALDKSRNKGDFFLTGSQRFQLMENATESLAGRAGILELLGLSLRELRCETWDTPFLPTTEYLLERKTTASQIESRELWNIIHRGSFPEICAEPDYNWGNFYSDYVQTYLERDVRKLSQVADLDLFRKFMTVCASGTGQLLNLNGMAIKLGISQPTAKRWLSILQTSGLVYLLQPYYNNILKRETKTPKLYFLDTGLAAYLTRWLTSETLSQGAMSGEIFETFVIAEVLKSYINKGKQADIFYLREREDKEIDLLIFQNNTLYPIEIKQTSAPGKDKIKNFKMLEHISTVNIGEGGVICPAADILPLDATNKVIPLWAI